MTRDELTPKTYTKGGILLGKDDSGRMIGSLDDRHLMTVAGSRAGKSSTCLKPNLMLWPSSVLCIDPKGELASATAAHRAAMGHDVYILDPFEAVTGEAVKFRASFDPLSEIKVGKESDIIDNAALLADAMIVPASGQANDHWSLSAKNLLRGLILFALHRDITHGMPASLNDVREWVTYPLEESEDTGQVSLSALFAGMTGIHTFGGVISGVGATMKGKPTGEKGSIISTAVEQTSFLDSEPMQDHLKGLESLTLPTLRTLKRKPTTIYLVLPASRMGTHFRWFRMILTLAMAALENEPQPEGAPPVLFILEEFPQLGYMRQIEAAAGLMAGYGVKLWTILQDLSQIKTLYRDSWETFIGNAGVIQAFGNTDATTLEYISRNLGDLTITETTPRRLTVSSVASGEAEERENNRSVPLLAPFEIAQYCARETQKQIIMFAGKPPAYIDRLSHTEVDNIVLPVSNLD